MKYDSTSITETILRHWRDQKDNAKPFKTTDGQPMLLIVEVDVLYAPTVTFYQTWWTYRYPF
ncbi:MAG: hypothetical protein WKF36_09840 [Candidatus Nitrosocosmicus sp.]